MINERCHMMLEDFGLTQPKTVMIASSRDDIIEKQFTKLGLEFPVVVKKLEGSYGIGVHDCRYNVNSKQLYKHYMIRKKTCINQE